MNFKFLKDVLLLKPAITPRNLVTVALVALFFGVYVASGGKVTAVPKVSPGESFGAIRDKDGRELQRVSDFNSSTEKVTKEKTPSPAGSKSAASGRKVSPSNTVETTSEEVGDADLGQNIEPEVGLEDEDDDFSALEKRLKLNTRKKSN